MRLTLFELFGFSIPSHSVVSVLAILLGLGVTLYFAKQEGKNSESILTLAYATVLGGILGARLWHVLFFNPGYYMENPLDILLIWEGGMSVQGGLIGGIFCAVWYVRKLNMKFWETADLFAPGLILGQGIGRAACFLNGDAYGAPTGSSFGIVFPPGTNAYDRYQDQPLWPAEVWEGQWNLLVFALLLIMKGRPLPKGVLFVSYVILYSAGRFVLEYFRGDSPDYMFGWTAGQWTSVSAVIVTLVLFMVTKYLRPSTQ